jgi:hypothetical protein
MYAGAVALLGAVGPNVAGLVIVAVAGAAGLLAEVVAVTLLQRAAPDQVVARLFGVYDQLNVGAIAVGSLVAGPCVRWMGAAPALITVATACLVVSGVLLRHTGPPRSPAASRSAAAHHRWGYRTRTLISSPSRALPVSGRSSPDQNRPGS